MPAQSNDVVTRSGNAAPLSQAQGDFNWLSLQNGTVPIGTIIAYSQFVLTVDEVPGYLVCDGSAVSQSTYPKLYAVISDLYDSTDPGIGNFRLPDLRGQFIRGTSYGSALDTGPRAPTNPSLSGEETGSVESGMLKTHNHFQAHNASTVTVAQPSTTTSIAWSLTGGSSNQQYALTSGGANVANIGLSSLPQNAVNVLHGTGEETRPFNISMSYLIKVDYGTLPPV